jgi:TatD DNase family protein
MARYIDSHAHIFDLKKDYVLPSDIFPVVVGYSHGSNAKAARVAEERGYPYVLGIAPQTTVKEGTGKVEEWVEFIRSKKPCAIGEVGLDYKWATTQEQVEGQRMVFRRMLELAAEMGLPLVIHSRDNPSDNGLPKEAIEEIIGMTRGRRLVMHFFSGTEEQAVRIAEGGGYISIMHLHSKERRKVINSVPLDRLLVESDSPYVGRTPETVRDAVAYIAEVKGLQPEKVAEATAENAMRFFGFRAE